MYKKIIFVGAIIAFVDHSFAASPDFETKKPELTFEEKKAELTTKIIEAVNQCKCLAGLIDGKEKLFPLNPNPKAPHSIIKTRGDYLSFISDMKINANKSQTKAKKILSEWPKENANQTKMDRDVSEELRAMSSYCFQPFTMIAKEIYDRSSIFTRKKIDPKKCGIVQNK